MPESVPAAKTPKNRTEKTRPETCGRTNLENARLLLGERNSTAICGQKRLKSALPEKGRLAGGGSATEI